MSTIYPFITTTLLACISEILPVIRNDILKILSDFIQFCQRLMSQIFSKRVPSQIWKRYFGWLNLNLNVRRSGLLGQRFRSSGN